MVDSSLSIILTGMFRALVRELITRQIWVGPEGEKRLNRRQHVLRLSGFQFRVAGISHSLDPAHHGSMTCCRNGGGNAHIGRVVQCFAEALVGREEERFILFDRSAGCSSKLVPLERGNATPSSRTR